MRRSRFAAYVSSLLLALAAVLTGTATAHAAAGPLCGPGRLLFLGCRRRQLHQLKRRLQAQHEGVPLPLGGRPLTLVLHFHGLLGRPNG